MKYACCFCGETIERKDAQAIAMTIRSLWHSRNEATQGLQAHSECIAKALDKDVPFLAEIWGQED